MSAFGQQAGAADDATHQQQQQAADTSATETGTQQSARENWEERYKEAQGWGTRLSQENAALLSEAQLARALQSQDPDERRGALEQLGLSIVEEPDQNHGQLYDEPDPRLMHRLDALEQHVTSASERQEEAANYTAYRGMVDPQLEQIGVPAGLRDVIAEAALNLPPVHTPQGPVPDLQGAWEQFGGLAEHFAAIPAVQNAVKQAWAKTKPTRALSSPAGVPGTRTVELNTRVKRSDYIAQRIAELEAEEASGT